MNDGRIDEKIDFIFIFGLFIDCFFSFVFFFQAEDGIRDKGM